MNISFPKTFFASLALSSLVQVHGDVVNTVRVFCLPDDPSICIGEKTTTEPKTSYECPDLPDTSTCGYTVESGTYNWEFIFVDGLSEGEGSDPVIQAAKTGLVVKVDVEEDLSCTISTGDGQTCNSCEVCDFGDAPSSMIFDCLNLPDGRATNGGCFSVEPFLYPFIVDSLASPPSTPSSSASHLAFGSLMLPLLVGVAGLLV